MASSFPTASSTPQRGRSPPAGTRIDNGGLRTVNALTTFEWKAGEDLNDMLVSKVTETLMQFASVLMPILCLGHR